MSKVRTGQVENLSCVVGDSGQEGMLQSYLNLPPLSNCCANLAASFLVRIAKSANFRRFSARKRIRGRPFRTAAKVARGARLPECGNHSVLGFPTELHGKALSVKQRSNAFGSADKP